MKKVIPYGCQSITEADIASVVDTLKAPFLTQGPKVKEFEEALSKEFNVGHSTAVSNATLGLNIAYRASGLTRGSLLWTVPNTFVATANAAIMAGAEVDFVDIDLSTFCMSVSALEQKLEEAKKINKLPDLVVPVHFAGLPVDLKAINELALKYNFKVIADAAHAVGAYYEEKPVAASQFVESSIFSFHPVKIITTGEGGVISTNKASIKKQSDLLASHGITKNPEEYLKPTDGPWYHEQIDISLNARLTDIQSALGVSQLNRLKENISRRKELAKNYQEAFADLPIEVQAPIENATSAWHLFVIKTKKRLELFNYMRANGVLVNVHYIPVHTQPYYQNLGFKAEACPNSIEYYSQCLSLPMYHSLSDADQSHVIKLMKDFFS